MAMMEVRYVGPSTYRMLTGADLKQHGIESLNVKRKPSPWEETFVRQSGVDVPGGLKEVLLWGPHNGHSIVLDVTPDMERLLRNERHFAIVALNDDGQPQEKVAEPEPQEAAAITGVVVYEEEGKPTQTVEQSGQQADLPSE